MSGKKFLLVLLLTSSLPIAHQEVKAQAINARPWCIGVATRDPSVLFNWRCQSKDVGVSGLDESIVTDRPDFTEASSVVGLRVLQLETGYTYLHDGDGTARTIGHSYPEALFRYGVLADWLEFRLAANFAAEKVGSNSVSGAEDLYLGFKIGLTAQDGWRPEMALVPQMTVPTGSSEFTSNEVLPGLNWLYGWDISDMISTAGSTQLNRSLDVEIGNEYNEWAQSWTVGYSLTERIGAYTEWFAFIPSGSDTAKPQQYLDGGLTVGITNDIQWDVRAGIGLNAAADDYFVGTGMSFRFR